MRKLKDKVPPQKAETLLKRYLYCAGMLHINGLLSDSERKKVHQRMVRLREQEEKK